MSSTTITAIVQRTRNTLDMMHRGNIAQAPNVMKTLVRAAENVNKLPKAAFVDAEYRGLVPDTEHDEHIIGVCNIHLLSGKFLVAQAFESDDYINLLNEDLDIEILEDAIIFLAKTLLLGININTWASENYVASRKRGRVNKFFLSSDYTGDARKTLLNPAAV